MTSSTIRINPRQGQIVVANRTSGNLSILNESTGNVIGTIDLPMDTNGTAGEPMYISYLNRTNEVAVADRANNQIVFFDRIVTHSGGTANAISRLSLGFADHGLIRDFNLAQGDVIRLHGSADLYQLGVIQGDTTIFYNAPDQTPELVGIVENVVGLDLTSDAFEYATV
ncbi:hypothetical protein Lepto7375DRAFT_1219 [Leptolyngbya sp. PCC 7375]|nr:hypothetical protein Lepto7375DRAFT_1219 [Leptolyngbya sp. PCC 7375]